MTLSGKAKAAIIIPLVLLVLFIMGLLIWYFVYSNPVRNGIPRNPKIVSPTNQEFVNSFNNQG